MLEGSKGMEKENKPFPPGTFAEWEGQPGTFSASLSWQDFTTVSGS